MKTHRLTPLLVGRCPSHWEPSYIEEITDLLTNGFVGSSLPHQTESSETGIRYLQGFNVRPNRLDLSRTTWVTHDFHANNRKSQLREGDVLVVQSGHIGTAAVVSEEAAGSNCHAVIICRFKQDFVDPEFASQYLNSGIGQARLRGLHVGSSLPHINTGELGRFKLPLPPLSEQRRLAEIWKTWDTAIQKTEQLAAAKERNLAVLRRKMFVRNARPGLVRVRLESVLKESGELSDGSLPVYSVSVHKGLINQIEHLGRSFSAATTAHYSLVRPGDIVYTKSPTGDFPYGIVKQSLAKESAAVSPLYGVYRPSTNDVGTLVDFFFESPVNAKNYLHPLVQKGAKNTLSIGNDQFLKGEVTLPESPQEVARLSSLIRGARREIALLERRVELLAIQKRGLMQKLLTGQWRLPVRMEETA